MTSYSDMKILFMIVQEANGVGIKFILSARELVENAIQRLEQF